MSVFFKPAIRFRRRVTDGFPHGGEDMRLGDATEIGSHRGRPVRRHVERHRRRQLLRRRMGVGLALPRLLDRVDGERGTMGEQRHDAGMVQTGNEVPQVRNIARHVRRPSGVTIRQRLPRRGVLDPVRMGCKEAAGRADFEAGGIHAAIEGLHRQRMGDGDQRHVRLLAQGKAKAQPSGARSGHG